MRCDECRHWRKEGTEDWEAEAVGFGWCIAVRPRWHIQDEATKGIECEPDPEFEDWNPDSAPSPQSYEGRQRAALAAAKAYVQDGSQYRAELYTAPDFFCALFAQGIVTEGGVS
jgi:hypothetical protein